MQIPPGAHVGFLYLLTEQVFLHFQFCGFCFLILKNETSRSSEVHILCGHQDLLWGVGKRRYQLKWHSQLISINLWRFLKGAKFSHFHKNSSRSPSTKMFFICTLPGNWGRVGLVSNTRIADLLMTGKGSCGNDVWSRPSFFFCSVSCYKNRMNKTSHWSRPYHFS